MKRIIFLCVFTATLFFILKTTMAQWVTEAVDDPKYFNSFDPRSIAIDSSNHPHIAYGGDHLYYANYDVNTWHYETIDSSGIVGSLNFLALDSANNVHISYYDAANDDLKYVTCTSGSWNQPETIDSSGWVGVFTSLALDSANNVHISYYDDTNDDLKYASQDSDYDGIKNENDNCPNTPNSPDLGTCVKTKSGMIISYRVGDPKEFITCTSDAQCTATGGTCDMSQGNCNSTACGDACECYMDCNNDGAGDSKVTGSDLAVLKQEYGRFDCDDPDPCYADGNEDGKVNGADLSLLKNEYGRFDCPACP